MLFNDVYDVMVMSSTWLFVRARGRSAEAPKTGGPMLDPV